VRENLSWRQNVVSSFSAALMPKSAPYRLSSRIAQSKAASQDHVEGRAWRRIGWAGGIMATVIYKCSCGAYHPWASDGDRRDDDNRYSSPEDYAEENSLDLDDIEVRAIDAEDDEVDDGEDDKTDEDDDDDEDEDEDDQDEDDQDERDDKGWSPSTFCETNGDSETGV
jgi:hypothetical protein